MAEGDHTERVGSHRATTVLNGPIAETTQADFLELPEDEVHVWIADHRVDEGELEACSSLLDPAERERASRFRFHKDYRKFVFGHARLRSILGRYCGASPDALLIARRCAVCGSEEHGKPSLLSSPDVPSTIGFSISYSDQLVVVAVSNGAEIGVDVERVVPDFPWRQVAETALSPRERSLLAKREPVRAFFGIWTRKEAVSKASAQGLEQLTRMDTCDWTYGEDGAFEVYDGAPRPSWAGRALAIPGHEAAVAVEGRSAGEWSVRESPGNLQSPEEGA